MVCRCTVNCAISLVISSSWNQEMFGPGLRFYCRLQLNTVSPTIFCCCCCFIDKFSVRIIFQNENLIRFQCMYTVGVSTRCQTKYHIVRPQHKHSHTHSRDVSISNNMECKHQNSTCEPKDWLHFSRNIIDCVKYGIGYESRS